MVTNLNINVIKDNSIPLSKLENSLQTKIGEIANKADADGNYPNMSVGVAEDLGGSEFNQIFNTPIRVTAEGEHIKDGTASIKCIRGNSMVWNQKVRSAIDSNGELGWWRRSSMDAIELSGNKVIIKAHAVADGDSQQITQNVNFIANHKYLVVVDYAAPADTICTSLQIIQQGDRWGNTTQRITSINNPIKGHSETFHTAVADMSYLSIYFYEPITFVSAEIEAKVIDLTQMFGAGSEPTTIDELYLMIPQSVDTTDYNEGEVIHFNGGNIKSISFNQWDEEWEEGGIDINTGQNYSSDTSKVRSKNFIKVLPSTEYYIRLSGASAWIAFLEYDKDYNFLRNRGGIAKKVTTSDDCAYIRFYISKTSFLPNDICINLSDASKNGTYEPYVSRVQELPNITLSSAGSAHDEIRYNKATQKWEKIQRIGEVNLGDLNFSKSSAGEHRFYSLGIKDKIHKELYGLTCTKFIYGVLDDNHHGMTSDTNGTIYFSLPSCTDPESFKEYVQGVMLLYVLAEPIVTELEDDLNLDYQVWNKGTEMFISDTKTSLLDVDVTYNFKANDWIKENRFAINNINEKIGNVVDYSYVKSLEDRIAELENKLSQITVEI